MKTNTTGKIADENLILTGVIWKQLLIFFYPLMLGTFFQTLYNTVDAMIVGRFVGTLGLSAVGGAAAMIINLLVGFFVGVSSGATVVISQYYGARREKELSQAVHTAVAIAIAGGIIMTVLCLILAKPALYLMGTPAGTMHDSLVYLCIYAIGMVPLMIYNMEAGILRAVGDSTRPTIYLAAGMITNIVTDLLFIAYLKMGVAGAALATIISETVSAVLIFVRLIKVNECYSVNVREIRFHRVFLEKILSIGVPAGFRSMMYSLSNIVIQTAVNGFGTERVAAWAVWGKIDCLYWMVISSFGTAATTFVGQNYGAGRKERVRGCTRQMIIICMTVTALFSVGMYEFSPFFIRLFSDDQRVISSCIGIAGFMTKWYFTYVCIEVFSSILIGLGDAFIPTIITVLGVCVLRIGWIVYAVPKWHVMTTVLASYPITWVVTSTGFIIYYLVHTRKLLANVPVVRQKENAES